MKADVDPREYDLTGIRDDEMRVLAALVDLDEDDRYRALRENSDYWKDVMDMADAESFAGHVVDEITRAVREGRP